MIKPKRKASLSIHGIRDAVRERPAIIRRNDVNRLLNENIFLKKEIEKINKKLVELEQKLPETKMVIVRKITSEECKKEIKDLFTSGKTLYYSDIADELNLDLKTVVDVCQELIYNGEVCVDEEACQATLL